MRSNRPTTFSSTSEVTAHQQWTTFFSIALTVIALIGGLFLRARLQGSTSAYQDTATGIGVNYPTGWIVSTGTVSSNYVFLAEDPAAIDFKTNLSVAILPIGPNATIGDVTQLLTLRHAQIYAAYHTLSITTIPLTSSTTATDVSYAYAYTDPNPFLSSVPVVVRADDVIILSHGEAIVVGYAANAQTYSTDRHYFDAFLRSLRY